MRGMGKEKDSSNRMAEISGLAAHFENGAETRVFAHHNFMSKEKIKRRKRKMAHYPGVEIYFNQ